MDFRKIGCEVLAFNRSVIKFQKKNLDLAKKAILISISIDMDSI
jgi:hypothetical protein